MLESHGTPSLKQFLKSLAIFSLFYSILVLYQRTTDVSNGVLQPILLWINALSMILKFCMTKSGWPMCDSWWLESQNQRQAPASFVFVYDHIHYPLFKNIIFTCSFEYMLFSHLQIINLHEFLMIDNLVLKHPTLSDLGPKKLWFIIKCFTYNFRIYIYIYLY